MCLHALWPLHGYCHARLVFLAVSFVNASITFHLLFQKLFYYWWSFHPLLEPTEPFLVPVLAKIQTPQKNNAEKALDFKPILIFSIWNYTLVNFIKKLSNVEERRFLSVFVLFSFSSKRCIDSFYTIGRTVFHLFFLLFLKNLIPCIPKVHCGSDHSSTTNEGS